MPRVAKCRRVCAEPAHKVFRADDVNGEAIVLCVEELESIRLTDFEDLDQDEAAKRMEVSRGTFQRILYAARHKIASALVTGKTIVIEGGNYEVSGRRCGQNRLCKCCCYDMDEISNDEPCKNKRQYMDKEMEK